ncbi:gluconate 2-dehydrogenase gamma chain [Paraburkholderia fungorum]|uniref:Gluconate 2-dehydrogenase gamma chain n=1 Tax=Paraburkholderia fungorum TaxID=134537 RepID=A0A1H1JZW3_9BURK|nr:gluconate 2-dehydrogenase subunit 3 family protein [Paraburkholderia fungorum]SDR55504.1 gluconate 2-dehydrogenase gamma chain [Paraburkholderia fungorum]
MINRRTVLKAGLALISTATAAAIYRPAGAAQRILFGGSRWLAKETPPPVPVDPTQRVFFTDAEAAQIKAIFDRLIPADELSVSASEAGCVAFIDHQLAGSYGDGAWKYQAGPYAKGTGSQGDQSPLTPAQLYRKGLAEIDAHCRQTLGHPFEALTADQQDHVLEQMDAGKLPMNTIDSGTFFKQLLANVQEGFFADPIYGGNKDMAGWKMIGFPGARYDYRDYVEMKGKPMNIEPVSLAGRI